MSKSESARGFARRLSRVLAGDRGERFVHRTYHYFLRRSGRFTPPEDAETLVVLRSLAARARTILDVGANTGRYAHLFLQAAPPEARLHAFEPLPSALWLLRSNTGSDTRARIHALALGDADERVEIAVPTDAVGNPVTALAHLDAPIAGERRVWVDVRRLDALVAAGEVALARPVLAKIDVEGHEAAVLDGATALLDARAIVYFESQDDHLVRAGGRSPWQVFGARGYVVLARSRAGWRAVSGPLAECPNYLGVPAEVMTEPGGSEIPQSAIIAALSRWVAG